MQYQKEGLSLNFTDNIFSITVDNITKICAESEIDLKDYVKDVSLRNKTPNP